MADICSLRTEKELQQLMTIYSLKTKQQLEELTGKELEELEEIEFNQFKNNSAKEVIICTQIHFYCLMYMPAFVIERLFYLICNSSKTRLPFNLRYYLWYCFHFAFSNCRVCRFQVCARQF